MASSGKKIRPLVLNIKLRNGVKVGPLNKDFNLRCWDGRINAVGLPSKDKRDGTVILKQNCVIYFAEYNTIVCLRESGLEAFWSRESRGAESVTRFEFFDFGDGEDRRVWCAECATPELLEREKSGFQVEGAKKVEKKRRDSNGSNSEGNGGKEKGERRGKKASFSVDEDLDARGKVEEHVEIKDWAAEVPDVVEEETMTVEDLAEELERAGLKKAEPEVRFGGESSGVQPSSELVDWVKRKVGAKPGTMVVSATSEMEFTDGEVVKKFDVIEDKAAEMVGMELIVFAKNGKVWSAAREDGSPSSGLIVFSEDGNEVLVVAAMKRGSGSGPKAAPPVKPGKAAKAE